MLGVTTFNVAGFRQNKLKLQNVLNEIKNFDIVCLQETHFQKLNECMHFNNLFSSNFKMYHSVIEQNSRGMSILINHKQLGTNFRKIFEIPGRALALCFSIKETSVLVVGVYAPANAGARPTFFNELNQLIEQCHTNTDVMFCLGDFNFVEAPVKDRSGVTEGRHEAGSAQFTITKNFLGVKDIYREQNPQGVEFSHYSKQYKTQSRIDRIYGNSILIDCFLQSESHTVRFSGHKIAMCSFMIDPLHEPRGPLYWKLNTSI